MSLETFVLKAMTSSVDLISSLTPDIYIELIDRPLQVPLAFRPPSHKTCARFSFLIFLIKERDLEQVYASIEKIDGKFWRA